jgi:hypothetical protein
MSNLAVLRRVDAVTVPVPDLDQGLQFYRDQLGHELVRRNDAVGKVGLRLPGNRLLRQPLRPGLAPQRLQLVNVVLLCGLLALTLGTGTYDAAALDLSQTAHRVFVALFLVGLAAFVLLALVPLRRVRMGSNVAVAAGSIFLAVQLVLLYRPAAPDAVTIGSPLVEDWWVSQGGHGTCQVVCVNTSKEVSTDDGCHGIRTWGAGGVRAGA